MLINANRNPKYSLYYIGYEILKYLKERKTGVSIDEIYKLIQSKIDLDINIAYIYYALDWLFLMSIIKMKEERFFTCY